MSADEPDDDIVVTTGIGPGAEGVEIGRFKRPRALPLDQLVGIVQSQADHMQARARDLAALALPPFNVAQSLAAQWEHAQRWIVQLKDDYERHRREMQDEHDRVARSAFSALHQAISIMPRWIDPSDADEMATQAMALDGYAIPSGADYATAHRALARLILDSVFRLPEDLSANGPSGAPPVPEIGALSPDERDQWAGRSAAEDGGTDGGILWLSERLARHIEMIGTDHKLAKEVADGWRAGEHDRRRKASAGNPGGGYLFTGWGLPAVLAPTEAEVAEAEAWPPKAWQAIARAWWIAEVRPPIALEWERRNKWPHPVLFGGTVDAIARRDHSAWLAAGPTMDADTLQQMLDAIQGADGRAVLRALPWAAHEAACHMGGVATVWEDGPHKITAETMSGSATLVKVYAPKDPNETLRRGLRLSHDAEPVERLRELTALPLDVRLTDGSRNAGPLVSDVTDNPTKDGAGIAFTVSRTMHPGIAGTVERGALLVPVHRFRPPAYNGRSAPMLDALDLGMMREAAAMAPRADLTLGAPLDLDALLAEYGGPTMKRSANRLRAVELLGLDGSPGLWTTATDDEPPRWVVSRGPGGALYYMPGDPSAARVLRDGWELRKNAAIGIPPPRIKRARAATRKRRQGR